ncbi:hypothetical protein R4227_06025 [Gordonia amicalis]|uniref:hypothetical protein n=1 Tax=Gordonia amicalis TaxID=89053 RepID=UPI0029532460|nr:hypothetical protein [Gordonia amicalis]MDV7099699.1 hypothetical protein [Gordonia amicalis]
MRSPNSQTDQLIYAAADGADGLDWAIFQLQADGALVDHDAASERLDATRLSLAAALHWFDTYSDGRPVRAVVEIEAGVTFPYVFPPIVEHQGERLLAESPLAHDPGSPSRGSWRVFVDDSAGSARAVIVPPRPTRLEIIR